MGFRTQLEVWPELGGGPFLPIRDKKVGIDTDIEKYVGRGLGSWGSLYPVVLFSLGQEIDHLLRESYWEKVGGCFVLRVFNHQFGINVYLAVEQGDLSRYVGCGPSGQC